MSEEVTAPAEARSAEPRTAAAPPKSGSNAAPDAAFEGAKQRREIAAIVIDAQNSVAMANGAGLAHLRLLAPQGAIGNGCPLPDQVVRLVNGLREDLRRSGPRNSSLLTLPTGQCMRASLLDSAPDQYMLLLVEPFLRLDERNLSRRELEVATLVLNGLSNREIAETLVVAHHTVEGHLKRIFAKTQVRTRAGLVARMLGWHPEAQSGSAFSNPAIPVSPRKRAGGESAENPADDAGDDVE